MASLILRLDYATRKKNSNKHMKIDSFTQHITTHEVSGMVLELVIDLEVSIQVIDGCCQRYRAHDWILRCFVEHMKDA